MNELVIMQDAKAVTSTIKVAEVFGKEHKHVLESVGKLLRDVPSSRPMFYESVEVDSYNRDRKVYLINRDGFTLLAMGFTGKKALGFKLQYIDAFNKMEEELKNQSTPSYQIDDPIERAKQWIVEQEKTQLLETTIRQQAPKVQAYDHLMNSDGLIGMANFAKHIGIGRNTLMRKLRNDDILQDGGYDHNIPYQTYMDRGYFDVVSKPRRSGNGIDQVTLVTAKGAVWLTKRYADKSEANEVA